MELQSSLAELSAEAVADVAGEEADKFWVVTAHQAEHITVLYSCEGKLARSRTGVCCTCAAG